MCGVSQHNIEVHNIRCKKCIHWNIEQQHKPALTEHLQILDSYNYKIWPKMDDGVE